MCVLPMHMFGMVLRKIGMLHRKTPLKAAVARGMPAVKISNRVDLPIPLAPKKPIFSPRSTSKETSVNTLLGAEGFGDMMRLSAQ